MKFIPVVFLFTLLITNSLASERFVDSNWPTTIEKKWPINAHGDCSTLRFVHLNFCIEPFEFKGISVLRFDEPGPLNISFSNDDKIVSFIFYTNDEIFSVPHLKSALSKINVSNIKEKYDKIGMLSNGNKIHIFWKRQARLDAASKYIHYSKPNFDAYLVVSKDSKYTDELSIVYKSKSGYELYSITGKFEELFLNDFLSSIMVSRL